MREMGGCRVGEWRELLHKIVRNGKVLDTARTSAPVDVFWCTYRNVSIVFNVPYVASNAGATLPGR